MQPTENNSQPKHEVRDVHIRGVVTFCLCLAVAVLLVTVVLWGLFHVFSQQAERREPEVSPMFRQGRARQDFPAPQLQPPPPVPGSADNRYRPFITDSVDLETMQQRERYLLNSYGWVDQNAGIVHIPIEQAMEMVIERGLPTRPAPQAAQPKPEKRP
ncbi:MAG TPA: hypothetical protein VLT85_12540 [Terriglobales bacterium]|nr:hypothetical protein [Terriglobales bacterium]